MLVDVTLAGYTSSWAFAGSKKFNAWADTKPWISDGGICVIRTAGSDYYDFLFSSIGRTVRGIQGDGGRFDVRRIECGGFLGTPFSALLSALGIAPNLGVFEARDPIRDYLQCRPTAFVFVELEPVDPADWEVLVNLIEHYRKASKSVCICAVVLDPRGVVHSEPMCDFTVGRTTHQVLAEAADVEEAALWPAYLHQRLCWEAGGNIGYALSLSRQISEARTGDDDQVEEWFQSHSAQSMSHQPAFDDLKELVALGPSLLQTNQQRADVLRCNLLLRQLLWRPPGMQSLRVVPWASRVLLVQQSVPDCQVWTLRHSLVCAPLATEILALCLQSESHIRAKLHGRGSIDSISSQTHESYERFKSGEDEFVVYPNKHPAPPHNSGDIWAFASLGETLRACPKSAVSDLYRSTVRLRNCIAHGHYVGWHQVKIALRQLRHFDTA